MSMIAELFLRQKAKSAMKMSKKDTDRDFRMGPKRYWSKMPATTAQKAFYKRLKRLAPKSRRKRLLQGPF